MRNDGISLRRAAAWCGGVVRQEHAEITFHGANFDTRRLLPGELFTAILDERDGHAFARDAMTKGAAAVLASEALPEDIPTIYVPDTVQALQEIARGYRESLNLCCVGVTGSVGKTTTKEMIAAVLETSCRTCKTAENFNNALGLPVTVLSMPPECEAAVLEMGMNHPGELSRLTRIAQPDIAVITNIGTMHIENLGSREGILRAKLEIMEGLRPGGTALLNGDDALLAGVKERFHTVTFGRNPDNDVFAEGLHTTETQICFTAVAFGERFPIALPLLGEHNVMDALAAVAVGRLRGVSGGKIAGALANFRSVAMRQNIYLRDGIRVIEDCYNAGPESMRAALQVLSQSAHGGRKIAVLGGMLELGAFAPQAHFEIGQAAAEHADRLLAYGPCAEEYVRGAEAAGLKNADLYATHQALSEALKLVLRSGDTLLVKGSRGMKMERVIQLLFE